MVVNYDHNYVYYCYLIIDKVGILNKPYNRPHSICLVYAIPQFAHSVGDRSDPSSYTHNANISLRTCTDRRFPIGR